jgi:hypothetical protein
LCKATAFIGFERVTQGGIAYEVGDFAGRIGQA